MPKFRIDGCMAVSFTVECESMERAEQLAEEMAKGGELDEASSSCVWETDVSEDVSGERSEYVIGADGTLEPAPPMVRPKLLTQMTLRSVR